MFQITLIVFFIQMIFQLLSVSVSVMADLSPALRNAVSSSIVEICRKLLNFSSFVKITGSITFDVDGQQVCCFLCVIGTRCSLWNYAINEWK